MVETTDMKINLFDAVNNYVSSDSAPVENIKSMADAISKTDYAPAQSKTYSSVKYSELKDDEKREYNGMLSAVSCCVIDKIYMRDGASMSFSEIWELMHNADYAKLGKKERKVIYPVSGASRPVGDDAHQIWNGMQVIDLDIKDASLAPIIRDMLFDKLCSYKWFIGSALSSSHSGAHIYTKMQPSSYNITARKSEYMLNFRSKYAAVYSALKCVITKLNAAGTTNICIEDAMRWIDKAMAKPQQGAFIPYDNDAEFSTNFANPDIDYDVKDPAIPQYMAMVESDELLKEQLDKIRYFSENNAGEYNKSDIDYDISALPSLGTISVPKHYKHIHRWRLANTLNQLYGKDAALRYLHKLCPETPYKELAGIVNTAASHDKGIEKWAIKELRSLGFDIQLKTDMPEIDNDEKPGSSPMDNISGKIDKTVLKLREGQYMSDILGEIKASMGSITVLEAGAGYGKTEMVKKAPGRQMLVVPYTSIIASKIEADTQMGPNWLSYYKSKRVTVNDLFCDERSFVMTVDKFSRLNIDDIKNAGFTTVWIDESHLIFTSSYRDKVMPDAVMRIGELARIGVNVVLMTGTPTGEAAFFGKSAKYIKVERETDTRAKDVNITFSYKETESNYHMCAAMADAIISGKRVIFPTNQGPTFYNKIRNMVQSILNERNFGREIISTYYKKDNSGCKEMDDINLKKTVGNIDFLACTEFLSVGVDICDKYDFRIFFCESGLPHSVEQFANRVRNNDLHINIFLPEYTNNGDVIDYNTNMPFCMDITADDKKEVYNNVMMCNSIASLNKNNNITYSFIAGKISGNDKYVVYDEETGAYITDWTKYRLNRFEESLNDYMKQLPNFIKMMQYYGYTVTCDENKERFTDAKRERINEELKETARVCANADTAALFTMLDTLNTDNFEVYAAAVKNGIDFFKSDKYIDDRNNNNIQCTNVEVITRNLPCIKTLSRWYDFPQIKEVYDSCLRRKSNTVNMSLINKICNYVYIETKREANRLNLCDYSFIKKSVDFAIANPEASKNDIKAFIADRCCFAANKVDGICTFNYSLPDSELENNGSRKFLKALNSHFEALFWIYIDKISESRKTGMVRIQPRKLNWARKTDGAGTWQDPNMLIMAGDEYIKHMLNVKLSAATDDIENINDDTKKMIAEYDNSGTDARYISHIDTANTVTPSPEYYDYSEKDGSAERFRARQARTRATRISGGAGEQIIDNTINNYNKEMNDLFTNAGLMPETHITVKNTPNIKKQHTYNRAEDIEAGIDWDKIDSMNLLGDDGMGL